jgi:hypothetical protein
MGWMTTDSWFNSWYKQGTFLFTKCPDQLWGPPKLLLISDQGSLTEMKAEGMWGRSLTPSRCQHKELIELYRHNLSVSSRHILLDINGSIFHFPSLVTPMWVTNMPVNPLKYNSCCIYHLLWHSNILHFAHRVYYVSSDSQITGNGFTYTALSKWSL